VKSRQTPFPKNGCGFRSERPARWFSCQERLITNEINWHFGELERSHDRKIPAECSLAPLTRCRRRGMVAARYAEEVLLKAHPGLAGETLRIGGQSDQIIPDFLLNFAPLSGIRAARSGLAGFVSLHCFPHMFLERQSN
jgi:hypothetical protein